MIMSKTMKKQIFTDGEFENILVISKVISLLSLTFSADLASIFVLVSYWLLNSTIVLQSQDNKNDGNFKEIRRKFSRKLEYHIDVKYIALKVRYSNTTVISTYSSVSLYKPLFVVSLYP